MRNQMISIHSPRMGRDASFSAEKQEYSYFNPLSPHGERRNAKWKGTDGCYFNPLSPHGERPGCPCRNRRRRIISIHSPRMGRDAPAGYRWPGLIISIHSPRMGRDPRTPERPDGSDRFQSTLPAWGETRSAARRFVSGAAFQSTLPTRGETN